MGLALIVAAVPEELLQSEELCDVDATDRRAWLAALCSNVDWRTSAEAGALVERSPGAYLRVPLRYAKVWAPPAEPWQEHGLEWHQDPALRRAHRQAVRVSLEEFLHAQLARLYHMVRTGWWVLGKVRVRVTACRPVPAREMRAQADALRSRR